MTHHCYSRLVLKVLDIPYIFQSLIIFNYFFRLNEVCKGGTSLANQMVIVGGGNVAVKMVMQCKWGLDLRSFVAPS